MAKNNNYMKVEFTHKRVNREVWGINSWDVDDQKNLWLYVWESKSGANDGNVYIIKNAKVVRCCANNLPFAINSDETIEFLKRQ